MKTLYSLLAVVLLCSMSVFAQKPIQDTIPQLQEWWRSDNLQYGKYGMTWLDNFYKGNGALVVWTPQGVKTWLLRFPGDTMNVFTWEKGSSNIKTGDFNGDGITDYVDENGNIYEGIKNGEPPKAESVSFGQYYPEAIADLNGDGNDDIINTPTINRTLPSTVITVCFGKQGLKDMNWQAVKIKDIDSNNAVLSCYLTANHEIRLVCRRYFWYHDAQKQKVIQKDGYRLIRVWLDGNIFKSEILDEFTTDIQNGTGIFWQSALLPQTLGKHYLIGSTIISGIAENTNVTIYNLTNDRIEKLTTVRVDSIAHIGVFKHSIDGDSLQDWYIAHFQQNGFSEILCYSGIKDILTHQIGKYNVCQVPYGVSLPLPIANITQYGVVFSGFHEIYANPFYCFRIVKLSDILSTDKDVDLPNPVFFIKSITPQPVSSSESIKVLVSVPLLAKYEVSIYSYSGDKIFQIYTGQMSVSEKVITISLSDFRLAKGVYWLSLKVGGNLTQTKLIIN
jgi:hypothetical protein